MKRDKSLIAVLLAGIMVTAAFPAMAAPTGPGATPEADSYDAATTAKLEDNTVEYDEIADRVHLYNPDISKAWDTYMDSKEDYKSIVTELESRYLDIKDTADGYISAGNLTGNKVLVSTGKGLERSYKSTIQSMRDTVNKWDTNPANTKQLRHAEKQMTAGVQQAMIGYDTIRKNITTLETMVQLYERQSTAAQRQVELGLGTQKDLLSARSSLISAQSQLASLQGQQDSTRRTLCLLLGYDPDSSPEIIAVPEFDMNRITGMDLEQDTKKAIGNNYTLITQRTSGSGQDTYAQVENRLKAIDEGDQKLTIEMNRLYQDVMDKKAAYEASVTGFTAAESNQAAAERKYQNGMISEIQYLGLQLSYYQKKAEKEGANLSLLQAMETYDWAIDGQATVE